MSLCIIPKQRYDVEYIVQKPIKQKYKYNHSKYSYDNKFNYITNFTFLFFKSQNKSNLPMKIAPFMAVSLCSLILSIALTSFFFFLLDNLCFFLTSGTRLYVAIIPEFLTNLFLPNQPFLNIRSFWKNVYTQKNRSVQKMDLGEQQ